MSTNTSASRVSRILTAAHHTKSREYSTSIRGYRNQTQGYTARQYGAHVVVEWWFDNTDQRDQDTRRAGALIAIANTLTAAGYLVAWTEVGAQRIARLIVSTDLHQSKESK